MNIYEVFIRTVVMVSFAEDSMQISCADNPTLQRLEIRKMNLDRALLPGLLCAPLAYDPSFKGLCVFNVLLLRSPRQIVNINQTSKFTCFPRILQLRFAFMSHSGRFSFLQTMSLLKFWVCVSFVFGNPDETLALVFEIVVRNCTIRQNLLLIWPLIKWKPVLNT